VFDESEYDGNNLLQQQTALAKFGKPAIPGVPAFTNLVAFRSKFWSATVIVTAMLVPVTLWVLGVIRDAGECSHGGAGRSAACYGGSR